jgi:hypothetical protein
MGPDLSLTYTPHCLRRDFSPYMANQTLNQTLVDWIDTAEIFTEYDHRVQILNLEPTGITTHGGGHFAVGGEVGEVRFGPKHAFDLQQHTLTHPCLDVQHVLISGGPPILPPSRQARL